LNLKKYILVLSGRLLHKIHGLDIALRINKILKKSPNYIILNYHRVTNERYTYCSNISPKYLEKQMQYISKKFNIISLEKMIQYLSGSLKSKFSENYVSITFDDGYSDIIENVYPIIKKHHIPISVFLSTGAIGKKNFYWWDKVGESIRRLLKIQSCIHLDLSDCNSKPLENLLIKIRKKNLKIKINKILRKLKELPINDFENIMSKIIVLADISNIQDEKNRIMNWAEIKKLVNDGVKFYPHTVSHKILTKIPVKQAEKEIAESIAAIKEQINDVDFQENMLFAYPNGGKLDFNKTIIKFLKKNNVKAAVTTISGVNRFSDNDLYRLKRIVVDNDYIGVLSLKIIFYLFLGYFKRI
jgi:peptidoglycan/xylan/chitin deacetylase (PgdA/CDA1 family)